jgi:hypothetical protein
LPHAAADTEHVSRVEGAKQAVDQVLDVIRFKSVTNLKGDLPEGYINAGAVTVNGVGKVTANTLSKAATIKGFSDKMRHAAEEMAAIWGAIDATHDPDRKAELLSRYGAQLVKAGNIYASLASGAGLKGPYG